MIKSTRLIYGFSRVPSFSLEAIYDWVTRHLAPGCDVVSGGMKYFSAMQKSGHRHTVIIPGSGPESVKIEEVKWLNTIIGNLKNVLRGTFHAIFKKHFHWYLTEFCYRFNRRFELRQKISRLGSVAARTQPVTSKIEIG